MRVAVGQQVIPAPLPDVRTIVRGRIQESAVLRELVLDSSFRVVTITGPGGVGKTRLAIHVANEVSDAFEGDVAFVSLSAIRQAPLVMLAIGQSLGMKADPGAGYEDALIRWLYEHRTLLVLDNLEQVLDAAPGLQRLVDECPSLTILATSQVALSIPGEHVFLLAPLPTPDPEMVATADLAASDAVTLFMDRACEIAPGFSPSDDEMIAIARLCAALDGLPLAIELAAARANVLSPRTMLDRIDNRLETLGQHRGDVPDRLKTLRTAIAWSYDLLPPIEQALFRRLAVFESGISPEGAAFVSGDQQDVTSRLRTFAERNLLYVDAQSHDDERYQMLQTIRAYGIDQLLERGEEEQARRAHAEYIVWLAEEASDRLIGPDQAIWYARLDAAMPDLRAGVAWALEDAHGEYVLRIGGRLAAYFTYRGLNSEALEWLRQALADSSLNQSPYRSRALEGAGRLASYNHDHVTAVDYFQQARHLAQVLGDRAVERAAWTGLGTSAQWGGAFEEAMHAYTEAERIAREIGDPHGVAVSTGNLGLAHMRLGNYREAFDIWTETRRLFTEVGDTGALGTVTLNLGSVANLLGRVDEAERYLREALAIQESTENLWAASITLGALGELHAGRGDYETGANFFQRAQIAIHQLYGPSSGKDAEAILGLAWCRFRGGSEESGTKLLLDVLELKENAPSPVWLVGAMTLLADVLLANGLTEDAVAVLGAEMRVREETAMGLSQDRKEDFDRIQAILRERLDDTQYDAAWARGQAIPDDSLNRQLQRFTRQCLGRQIAEHPTPAADHDPYGLTPREIDVLRVMATGKSTREIATDLDISTHTVTTHARNILSKMDVRSRAAAVALAVSHGVISLGEET
jgi:predicted ATPase/DNA-binding CsgD family transcriptional regulator